MKYLLVLFLCLASAMMAVSKICNSAEDCKDDECCVNYIVTTQCRPLLTENAPCLIANAKNTSVKQYHLLCPCGGKLECNNSKSIEVFGHGVWYDPRCLNIESGTTEAETTTEAVTLPDTESPETESPETVSPETVSPETVSPETVSPETESPPLDLSDA